MPANVPAPGSTPSSEPSAVPRSTGAVERFISSPLGHSRPILFSMTGRRVTLLEIAENLADAEQTHRDDRDVDAFEQ